ncbi:hypothetical protein E5676_scaffold227G00020 [Cucumis melo var. makuwa]|uniref:Uncharacterized protein n=1 Tax=Cucumis melo var. makuwa TaxID=1194695 RepID=A0A5D3CII2_CUCMM|nr:hypothetical protein E5676_scaffold227G00020 [Cucumis melo var. makuwa]
MEISMKLQIPSLKFMNPEIRNLNIQGTNERFGMSSGPMEREPYIPNVFDVNYTEAPCFDMSRCNIGDISTYVSYSRSDHATNTGKFNL